MTAARTAFQLYLITDRKLASSHGGLRAMIEAALRAAPRGAVAIQLREKDLGACKLLELAIALRALCTRHGASLLINDRVDVALASGADGVHLPADSFAVADARALIGPRRLIGVSTHHPDEVARAAQAGADFTVFGPVYEPLSKVAITPACGTEGLAAACRAAAIPVYALGGINPERLVALQNRQLFQRARPAGAAVIGAVFGSNDPARATQRLLAALRS
ncbi:MAG: thiamine phosphate synthase [Candidatus Binataceae bacterium]